jgi:hypothetical protein
MLQMTRILTAVLLATHIVVGCCGHHAHARENEHQSAPVQETACQDGCPDGQTSDSHHSHRPGDCKGEPCSFIVTATHANGQSNAQYAPLPAALSLDNGSSLLSGSERSLFMVGRLLLPVRLHLANQVLLI